MEFFDPAILAPPPPLARETKTFTAKGGHKITLCVEVNVGGDITEAITNEANSLLALYGAGGKKEHSICLPSDKPVEFSWPLCYSLARLLRACVVPDDAPDGWTLWTVGQWALLSRSDHATWQAILGWLNEIEERLLITEEMPGGNDSGADADSGSTTPSTPPDATPT